MTKNPTYEDFDFSITKRDTQTRARLGVLKTPHGLVNTPNFIFCGTRATVKGVTAQDLLDHGVEIILSNTYHMMLQPGADITAQAGGLQKFTQWNGPMLTDSGGYQIFSLGHGGVSSEIKGQRINKSNRLLRKITEEGAHFRSYIDGSPWFLTPEMSIAIQMKLGADMILVLDELTPFNVDKSYTARSLRMSHRWADRCLKQFVQNNCTGTAGPQSLYGISQGGIYEDLRQESAEYLNSKPFFGHAVGGCLGETKEQMLNVVGHVMAHLRDDRPTHLLGIGGVYDIWTGVEHGIDTFDCVSPTRAARHGWALVKDAKNKFRMNIRNQRHKNNHRILDENCDCHACSNGYTRAYINHLIRIGEATGAYLLTVHNIRFMTRLMADIRNAIATHRVYQTKQDWLTSEFE